MAIKKDISTLRQLARKVGEISARVEALPPEADSRDAQPLFRDLTEALVGLRQELGRLAGVIPEPPPRVN
jgi:hypothetical protein